MSGQPVYKSIARALKPKWLALDLNILVVAKPTYPGCWKAFIGVVPGRSHDDEWERVAEHGTRLDQDLAEFLFPEFAATYAYDR